MAVLYTFPEIRALHGAGKQRFFLAGDVVIVDNTNVVLDDLIMQDSLFIVMPAYNEEQNIEAVATSWHSLLDGKGKSSRLVIADSGSTDGTHRILLGLKEKLPQLEILSDTGKQHGPKVIALYEHAIREGADFVFQTDSDGQTDPTEFDAFWQKRNEHMAVLGWRNRRGDGKLRILVGRVVCLLLRCYFGVKVPDANAPFRLMRASLVAKYLDRLPKDYNIPNIMLTTYFAYYKEDIVFEKISFKPRQGGINSLNLPKIAAIGIRALADFRRFRKAMAYL